MIALGLDIGGTSTRAVLVDHTGTCLGLSMAGPGNPVSVGVERATGAIGTAISTVLQLAGLTPSDVAGWTLAMAGGPDTVDPEAFDAALARLGFATPPSFAGDVLATFCSGTWRQDGYAMIVGTGAIAARIEHGAVAATADGMGWLVGDEGSAYWIGHQAVRQAFAQLEGRAPRTSLLNLLTGQLAANYTGVPGGGSRPEQMGPILEPLYGQPAVKLARFAPLVFEAADNGDPAAAAIIDQAVRGLANSLTTVLTPKVSGQVVLGGGVAAGRPDLARRVMQQLPSGGEDYRLVRDGVVGAAVLALRSAGQSVNAELFDRLCQSRAALAERAVS